MSIMECKMKEAVFKVYTREVCEGKYPLGLAKSVHFSLIEGTEERSLHHQYGVLFPKASVDKQNVIIPSYVEDVRIASVSSGTKKIYYITGVDVDECGQRKQENQGSFWCWTSEDLQEFQEQGLMDEEQLVHRSGLEIDKLRMSNLVEISADLAEAVKQRWNPLQFVSIEKAESRKVCNKEDRKVRVSYSDGSFHDKDLRDYPDFQYPCARGFGDPVILLWKNEYYYIATNDNLNDIGFYVRKAHRPEELFREDTPMHLILDKDPDRNLMQTFWAPEFHELNGQLYLLFAVSGVEWGPQCHIMKLREGGDILKPEDWEDPVRVRRRDGSFLAEKGITLDMTYVKSGDRHYYVWSYRENIGTSLDTGSMLMIAEFSPRAPYQLISEPVCLSRPLYGYENVSGTINNEGPYALYHGGKIYLSYSGGDARGYLYSIGMLTAEDGADLCDPKAWKKSLTPALEFASVPGEYGPGHNSFFRDRNGDYWIAFHMVTSYEERIISDAVRRVHFDKNDVPRLDMSKEEDLPEKYRRGKCI